MAVDYKKLAAKWRRAFWAAVDDAAGAKEILAAKKAKKAKRAPAKKKRAGKRRKTTQFNLF